jgi:hypothetical protein
MQGSSLKGSSFAGATMLGVDLRKANMGGVNLKGAKLGHTPEGRRRQVLRRDTYLDEVTFMDSHLVYLEVNDRATGKSLMWSRVDFRADWYTSRDLKVKIASILRMCRYEWRTNVTFAVRQPCIYSLCTCLRLSTFLGDLRGPFFRRHTLEWGRGCKNGPLCRKGVLWLGVSGHFDLSMSCFRWAASRKASVSYHTGHCSSLFPNVAGFFETSV